MSTLTEHRRDPVYDRLGRWTREIPTHCARPGEPHRLAEGRMLNGWAECSCGGHRTVRCLRVDGHTPCNAVHYVPAVRPGCSRSSTA
jgi:hypothetical protein